jgi:hypothetical protein
VTGRGRRLAAGPASRVARAGVAGLVLVASVVLGACAPTPSPTGSGAVGTVRLNVRMAPGATELHRSERRARILSAAAAIVFDAALDPDHATIATVPVGRSVVSAFTVFFGDFLVCPSGESASPGACIQPTLQPARTCDLAVDVGATPVELTFTVLSDGGCRLDAGSPPT